MRHQRLIGSMILALLVLVGTAASGSAATRRFTDPNDARGIDIRGVKVSYGNWLRVKASYDGRIRVGQNYNIWIDTTRRKAGPEFFFGFIPWSEVGSLQRVSGFRDNEKTITKCQKVDGGVNEDRAVIGWAIAGTCLGNPTRVRVSVQLVRRNGTDADWAPAFRRLYPWVSRYGPIEPRLSRLVRRVTGCSRSHA